MFEVEKCFKEANRLEVDETKLTTINETKSPLETAKNIQRSRLYEISESRKEAAVYPSDGIKDWFGDHHSILTDRKQPPIRVVRDGSGDAPQIQTEAWSDDSCKTLKKLLEKPTDHLSNRHCTKGIFTVNHFDDVVHQRYSTNNCIFEPSQSTIHFLEKSKKLILTLIDKELQKIESKPNQFIPTNQQPATTTDNVDAKRNLKIECINNIERELKMLKKLESLEQ